MKGKVYGVYAWCGGEQSARLDPETATRRPPGAPDQKLEERTPKTNKGSALPQRKGPSGEPRAELSVDAVKSPSCRRPRDDVGEKTLEISIAGQVEKLYVRMCM